MSKIQTTSRKGRNATNTSIWSKGADTLRLPNIGGKARNVKGTNIMIITDHFTRYAQAYITLKQIAVVVARTLWENFLVHYGWTEKILTDKEKSFENNLFRELCSLAKVKKLRTSP